MIYRVDYTDEVLIRIKGEANGFLSNDVSILF